MNFEFAVKSLTHSWALLKPDSSAVQSVKVIVEIQVCSFSQLSANPIYIQYIGTNNKTKMKNLHRKTRTTNTHFKAKRARDQIWFFNLLLLLLHSMLSFFFYFCVFVVARSSSCAHYVDWRYFFERHTFRHVQAVKSKFILHSFEKRNIQITPPLICWEDKNEEKPKFKKKNRNINVYTYTDKANASFPFGKCALAVVNYVENRQSAFYDFSWKTSRYWFDKEIAILLDSTRIGSTFALSVWRAQNCIQLFGIRIGIFFR